MKDDKKELIFYSIIVVIFGYSNCDYNLQQYSWIAKEAALHATSFVV